MPPRKNKKRARDSSNGSGDKGKAPAIPDLNVGVSDSVAAEDTSANQPQGRLVQNPHENHIPETYDDLVSDFYPEIFSNLESYLPTTMLNASRDVKVQYMRNVLNDYLPRAREQKQREYKQWVLSNYESRHREIYCMDPTTFFVPTFLKAIIDNTEQSFKSIISEPAPGVFTFEMFQPHFCELLLSEVENFEKWASATELQVMRPTTINKYGAVLDDFGLQSMLDDLMGGYISPLSKVLFEGIGGSTLDSHHGFVVEYGMDRDVELGFHVDDSEVTLNVCLGKQFSGGELYFRGMRCENHVNTESYPKEIFDYSQVPGQAVLHHGRHRHGARATTSGYRANLIMWCRSSCFRELIRHQTNFSSFCAKCYKERKTELRQSMDGIEMVQTRGEGESSSMDVNP